MTAVCSRVLIFGVIDMDRSSILGLPVSVVVSSRYVPFPAVYAFVRYRRLVWCIIDSQNRFGVPAHFSVRNTRIFDR